MFFLEPLKDPMLIMLIVAAFISIPIGMWENEWKIKGALEGIAILIAVFVVVVVTAYNDWSKEQEFKKLQDGYKSAEKCFVVRDGKGVELNFTDLVVGDLMVMQ